MSREDQRSVTVTVDNVNLDVFDGLTGGATEAEESKWRSGNMGPEISLGGYASTENIVVRRLFKKGRDPQLRKFLRSRVGKGRVLVVDQPLDVDGLPHDEPDTYTGTLQRFAPPDHDSNSSDAAVWELEVSTDEPVA